MDSAIAGRPRISWLTDLTPAFRGLRHSISGKLAALVIVFLAVPVVLYTAFRQADQEKRALLSESIRQQGQIIADLLRPNLDTMGGNPGLQIGRWLAALSVHGLHVRVLLRPISAPGPLRFYYMAAVPPGSAASLEADSKQLRAAGAFDKLNDTCEGGYPLSLLYTNYSGEQEILTSLTPVRSPSGCWIVITSSSPAEIGGLVAERPYWRRPEVQFAGLVYFLMAAVVMWLLVGLRGELGRFAEQARRIRRRRGGPRFADVNRVPELAGVAETLDNMVRSLEQSARAVRDAAEETAHALKSPIGIVAQSIEPLRARVAAGDAEGRRAIAFIDRSVERLGNLVGVVRELGEATAELIDQERGQCELSTLLSSMMGEYKSAARHAGVALIDRISPGIVVEGGDAVLEPIAENILDNALSFCRQGGSILVALESRQRECRLVVEDDGPGVGEAELSHLFDRYYSSRPTAGPGAPTEGDRSDHFGIGLWIVRRNVEALGGRVYAENRHPSGLQVVVTIPLAK